MSKRRRISRADSDRLLELTKRLAGQPPRWRSKWAWDAKVAWETILELRNLLDHLGVEWVQPSATRLLRRDAGTFARRWHWPEVRESLDRPCTACGAAIGDPCRTQHAVRWGPHLARRKVWWIDRRHGIAHYCPSDPLRARCGITIDADRLGAQSVTPDDGRVHVDDDGSLVDDLGHVLCGVCAPEWRWDTDE